MKFSNKFFRCVRHRGVSGSDSVAATLKLTDSEEELDSKDNGIYATVWLDRTTAGRMRVGARGTVAQGDIIETASKTINPQTGEPYPNFTLQPAKGSVKVSSNPPPPSEIFA